MGLRQVVGALLLDRVLRGDDEEGRRQRDSLLAHGDVSFLHGLEQGGLGFRRRAVDLIGQQHVGEDRPLHEAEAAQPGVGIFLQDVGAGDVRGHQVGCELDPLETDIQDPGDRADDQRLGQPGYSHQQAMTTGEDRRQHLVDQRILPNDHLVQFLLHHLAVTPELFEQVIEIALIRHGANGESGRFESRGVPGDDPC